MITPKLFKSIHRAALLLFTIILTFNPIVFSETQEARQHYNRGLEFEKQGQFPEALSEYEKAVNADRDFADAYNRIALLEMKKRKPYANKKAEQAVQKALELGPDNPQYHITYGKLLILMDFESQASDKFTLALNLDPTNVEALMLLGRLYRNRW